MLLITFLGIALIIAGSSSVQKEEDEYTNSDFTEINGTIVDYRRRIKEVSDSDGGTTTVTTFSGIIEYFVDGRRYRYVTLFPTKDKIGTEKKLKYNPENPHEVIIKKEDSSNYTLSMIGIILVILGLLSSLGGN